jgi:hypothetical protein
MKKMEYIQELKIYDETITIKNEQISYLDYIEYLSRTDLGKQYPKEDFVERIKSLVEKISISIVARNNKNQIIGNCFGLTDFAYWLFISDLGIDRRYIKKGLGRNLLKTAEVLAGGDNKVTQFLMANEKALGFYQNIGMEKAKDIFIKSSIKWTEFEVNRKYLSEIGI